MFKMCVRAILAAGTVLAGLSSCSDLHAGGSGLNVVVVANQASSNSCELANYFCEKRHVPPENVLRINWPGPNTQWTNSDFQTSLLSPLLAMLANRSLSNQIDYVVLSMDIPFQTANGGVLNGTSSALFYGLKTETGPDWANITNSYCYSEGSFGDHRPASAFGPSFLTTLITSDSLAAAKHLVDQGVASDGTFPRRPTVLAKSSDPARNFRFIYFDNAIFNVRLTGQATIIRTNLDWPYALSDIAGFETGLTQFSIAPNTFVPGAIADSLTSFGGIIFGPNDHTTALALIDAGASGSYGTVTEPSPIAEKFPNPQVYFYQARGFNIAESYYQSIFEPYEGIVVAEPLAAPFAVQGTGDWQDTVSNAVLSGTVNLAASFSAADTEHPLQQVDLFIDGKFFQTLTNITPIPGNLLKLHLNGHAINYTVSSNTTLGAIAEDLANLINAPATTNATRTLAAPHGDRVELQSISTNRPAPPGRPKPRKALAPGPVPTPPLTITNSAGTAGTITTYLRAARGMFMSSPAFANKTFNVGGSVLAGSWLRLTVKKASGATVALAVTNNSIAAYPSDLLTQLVSMVNSNSALSGSDGVSVTDFRPGFFGAASILLQSRSLGLNGHATRAVMSGSANLLISPTNQVSLDDNLQDTRPRNHLYLAAGLTNLHVTFPLDTTALSDGYHDLTAVAYEGTHVRTQTPITLPVQVSNLAWNADLTAIDLAPTNSVLGTYQLQVSTTATNVSAIHLMSTGGELNVVSNTATTTFSISASSLGVGLHPFYALVETSNGQTARTRTIWSRFISGP